MPIQIARQWRTIYTKQNMDVKDMYPLDLQEFYSAIGMADCVIQALEKCWKEKVAVDDFVHKRLIYAYLYVDVLGERTSDGLSML